MFIRIKDFELLDLDEREIRRILTNAGVSKKVAGNLMNGKFTPDEIILKKDLKQK